MKGDSKAKPAPVIAEAIDSLTQFLRQYTPDTPKQETNDLLGGRYRVHGDQPLPAFNTTLARAFAVTDTGQAERAFYALLFASGFPPRSETASYLKSVRHPHAANIVEAGVTEVAGLQGKQYVAIIEQPKGKTLAALLAERPSPWPDRFLISHIIAPLAGALQLLESKGLRHGRVNLDNIYFAETATLGEGIGEPAGYSQSYLYETATLLACPPAGKGESFDGSDMYALALVVLQLLLGRAFALPEKSTLERALRERGAYNVFIGDARLPETLADFFRGTLCEPAAERWRAETVLLWTQGRKTPAPPLTHPQDATRPFNFAGQDYSSRRALAASLFAGWEEARAEMLDIRLARWVEIGLRQPEQAETLQRIVRQAAGNPRMTEEALARSLLVLEPEGPLRLRGMAVKVDGLGEALCAAWFSGQGERAQTLGEMIEFDLAGIWLSQQKHEWPMRPYIASKLQKLRSAVRSQALGAGLERCLYELNLTLPCASPLVQGRHVTQLPELLQTMDDLARTQTTDTPPYDRHILAFIASRVDAGEIKIPMLSALPAFMEVTDAGALKLFALAQEKARCGRLPGLASWFGLRLLPYCGQLHGHDLQGHLASRLCKAAASGDMLQMLELITSQEIATLDEHGYVKALRQWHATEHRIKLMQHPAWVAERATQISQQLIPVMAYIIFGIMAYISFMQDV